MAAAVNAICESGTRANMGRRKLTRGGGKERRMTRWYCGKLRARAGTSGEGEGERMRGGGGREKKREKEIEKPFSCIAKNSRDAVARPVHDRQIPVR